MILSFTLSHSARSLELRCLGRGDLSTLSGAYRERATTLGSHETAVLYWERARAVIKERGSARRAELAASGSPERVEAVARGLAAAEALIRDLMARQPAAPYLLAQVVLVQEQGLRNLQARVEELERAERPQGNGFLGGLFGGRAKKG